jgi:hypothetical protein
MIDLSTLGLSADAGHTLAALVREDLASGHLPALEHAAALVSSYPLHGASLAHDFIASLLDSQGSYLGEVVGRLDGSLLCYSIAEEVCQARAAELIGE